MISVVPPSPVAFCLAWHARHAVLMCDLSDEPLHGGWCCYCDRSVAVPESARGKTVACIYCGLDRGLVPEVEVEPRVYAAGSNEPLLRRG